MSNILTELSERDKKKEKDTGRKRNWLTTIYLALLLLVNFGIVVMYSFEAIVKEKEVYLYGAIVFFTLLKIAAIVGLLKWKKIGFYAYLFTTLIIFGLIGPSVGFQVFINFTISVSLLLIMLHLKSVNDVSVWNFLE